MVNFDMLIFLDWFFYFHSAIKNKENIVFNSDYIAKTY